MTDYERLLGLCQEIDELIEKGADSDSLDFKAWFVKSKQFLYEKFGDKSPIYIGFDESNFIADIFGFLGDSNNDQFEMQCREQCKIELIKTKKVFESYLKDMGKNGSIKTQVNLDKTKIFIVHGHDGELKSEVARLIEKQDISAVILSEKANAGQTIMEKFEKYSDVSAAVLLFTADDVGKAKNGSELAPRARQNVVLEAGYFMAKLGRENTIIIYEDGVELPSDIMGMVYTSKSNWEVDLLKELRNIGYNIDFNLLYSE